MSNLWICHVITLQITTQGPRECLDNLKFNWFSSWRVKLLLPPSGSAQRWPLHMQRQSQQWAGVGRWTLWCPGAKRKWKLLRNLTLLQMASKELQILHQGREAQCHWRLWWRSPQADFPARPRWAPDQQLVDTWTFTWDAVMPTPSATWAPTPATVRTRDCTSGLLATATALRVAFSRAGTWHAVSGAGASVSKI